MRKVITALSLCASVLLSACASFHPNPTPTATLDKFKYQQTVQGVTIGIDPYFAPTKTQAVFDNDFEEHEMLALLVHTAVPEDNAYTITKTAITICDSNGKTFAPIDWKAAGQCVGRGYGYTVLWFFGTGIPGVIISAVHTAGVNRDIEKDLAAREFRCGPLKSRDCQGFIYYNLEAYKSKYPTDMTANITVENIKTKEPISFNIPFQPTAGWYGEIMPVQARPKVTAPPPDADPWWR